MNRQHFLIWVFLLFCPMVYGQDQTNFTQFYLNPYLLNPSYVGIDGRAALSVTYRKQWATIKDGPVISNVTFHAPLSHRVSLGLSVTNDKKGLLDNTGLMLSFGYNLHLSNESFFRFGISGGIASNTVDLQRLDGLEDPAIANLLDNNLSILGNTGISLHLNTFHFGVSLPVIFQPSYISKDAFTITELKPFESLIFHASNRFYFNDNRHIFEPYVVYRMTNGLPAQYEVAGVVHLNHTIWFGGSLKQDFGISALGGIKLKNTFAIGASYGIKNTGINELNSPTYEISLGILLGKHRKESPVYSFVNTEKVKKKKGTGKSASEMLAEKHRRDDLARKKQQEELARKQREEQARKQQEEAAKKQQDELAKKQQEAEVAARNQQVVQEQTKPLTQNNTANTTTPVTQNNLANTQAQQAEQQKKQQEEIARRQQEELARKQQEEAKRQQQEIARRQQEQEDETRRRNEALAQQQRAQQAQNNTQEVPDQEVFNTTTRRDTIVLKHKPRFNHIDASMEVLSIEVTEHNDQDELERIARLNMHKNDPDELHDGEAVHPNSERHEFVKKGAHAQELDVSDYVVVGVFKLEKNAHHFSDGLKKLGFKAKYGHLTEKEVWYVYLVQTNDINTARAQRDNFRKMKIFRDAWLLTVHH